MKAEQKGLGALLRSKWAAMMRVNYFPYESKRKKNSSVRHVNAASSLRSEGPELAAELSLASEGLA